MIISELSSSNKQVASNEKDLYISEFHLWIQDPSLYRSAIWLNFQLNKVLSYLITQKSQA